MQINAMTPADVLEDLMYQEGPRFYQKYRLALFYSKERFVHTLGLFQFAMKYKLLMDIYDYDGFISSVAPQINPKEFPAICETLRRGFNDS